MLIAVIVRCVGCGWNPNHTHHHTFFSVSTLICNRTYWGTTYCRVCHLYTNPQDLLGHYFLRDELNTETIQMRTKFTVYALSNIIKQTHDIKPESTCTHSQASLSNNRTLHVQSYITVAFSIIMIYNQQLLVYKDNLSRQSVNNICP